MDNNREEYYDECGAGRRKSHRPMNDDRKFLAGFLMTLFFLIILMNLVSLMVVAAEFFRARKVLRMLEDQLFIHNNSTCPVL